MFSINRRSIRRIVNGFTDKKTRKGLDVQALADSYKQTIWNVIDTLQEKDAYTLLNCVLHLDRWMEERRRGLNVTTTYERGDIVFVEYGAMNFGHEPSYEHPGIILANSYNTVLIAPGSSKTFNKGHRGVIDLPKTKATGLTDDTGVSVNDARWISKNRIQNRSGKVTDIKLLDKMDEVLMNHLQYSSVVSAHFENQIFDLNTKLIQADEEAKKSKELTNAIRKESAALLLDIESLIKNRAPDLLESYLQVAGAAEKKD